MCVQRFGYCGRCLNVGQCKKCYRGSHYVPYWESERLNDNDDER